MKTPDPKKLVIANLMANQILPGDPVRLRGVLILLMLIRIGFCYLKPTDFTKTNSSHRIPAAPRKEQLMLNVSDFNVL